MYMPYTTHYAYTLDNNGAKDPEKFEYIPKWNGQTHLVKKALQKPLKWKKPRVVFVCSMGDLFHESVPFKWIDDVFYNMEHGEYSSNHIYIILTKSPLLIMITESLSP